MAHQIKQQITWLIASGAIHPGEKLPTVRDLAGHLAVNLHTVRNAYRMLVEDGLVEMRQGRGVHVQPFEPIQMARSATAIRSHTVGVILPSFFNPFYHTLLHGIQSAAEHDRTLLFLCITQDDPAEAGRYYAQLAARQVDGIIVVSTQMEDFLPGGFRGQERAGLPQVTVDWPGAAGASVNLDLEGAGYQATRHLIEHGHARIGLLTHEYALANVEPVNAGYRRALAEARLHPDPALIAAVPGFDIPAGKAGARKLLNLPKPPTGIFAITDLLAVGALQAIRSSGRDVPGDIALVGFNDIPLAGLVDPPLTTVSAPAREMGEAAMRLLQELIAGRHPSRQALMFPTALVVRDSCGPHPSG